MIGILRYIINETEVMYHIQKQDILQFQVLKCESCPSFTVLYIFYFESLGFKLLDKTRRDKKTKQEKILASGKS